MNPQLPPVAPAVTAQLVAALTPRLRKRLDGGVVKIAGRPVTRDGDIVRIAVDDDTDLELHVSDGAVTSAEAIRCGCLLAPDCLHRAAAASAAPIAEPAESSAEGPSPTEPPRTAPPVPTSTPTTAPTPATAPPSATASAGAPPEDLTPESATPAQCAAAVALRDAAAAVLEAGTDGAGAVLQAELLRAAHTARLAGLPVRPAALSPWSRRCARPVTPTPPTA